MSYKEKLNCYCFNVSCKCSIYHDATCLAINIPLEVALSKKISCIECGSELLSPVLIEIRRDIADLINLQNQFYVTILDDDIIFQESVKSILKKQNQLKANFYMNGQQLMDVLESYKNNERCLPNIIFLDLDMPLMDGWEFLELFDKFNSTIDKNISIYIISNSVDPADHDRINNYSYIKSFISKPLTRHFLEKMNEELSRNF